MLDLNYLAVGVAAVAAFAAAFVYYAILGGHYQRLSPAAREAAAARPPMWLMPVELVKHLVIAAVLAGVIAKTGIAGWAGAATLGFALWIGFPVVLLTGSVIHEKVPWRLAVLHAGDWLSKLLIIAVIVGVWR
ncbi:DUF1761 domain-containing protein [Amycolatopsis anabasis]|uniref:DUF1761 domain-containing protein n=1 Tax=Amycolatopsis anabasis TaxID=1840409 RepID=UPI00131CB7B9|nr:DUF1761 domain-containing protein [Amycolatopsis anabasis]